MDELVVFSVFDKIKDIPGPNRVHNSLLDDISDDVLLRQKEFSQHHLVLFNLIYLLSPEAIKSGGLIKYIDLIKPHGDLKKFIMLSLVECFKELPISIVTKLSLMALVEGDGHERRWITCALNLISEGEKSNNLEWPLEFYSICRGSIMIRGRTIGIPIFSYHKGLRVIRNSSQKAIDSIIESRSKENTKSRRSPSIMYSLIKKISSIFGEKQASTQATSTERAKKTVVFVASRAFPGEANTHFNYLANSAAAINYGAENISVKLALSPEDVLLSPWADFGFFDEHKMRFHQKKWREINSDSDSIFPGNAINSNDFCKFDYMNKMFEWIDKQSPDLVVFLSGVYESYVARALSSLKYKTAILPTSVNHMPLSYYDYVICTSEVYKARLIEHQVKETSIISLPVVVNIFQNKAAYASKVRNNQNEFIMATVIGGGRLLKSFKFLTKEEILTLEQLFELHPNLVWILVGEPQFDEIISISKVFETLEKQGRIKGIAHVKEIRSFFQDVDVVFNLPDEAGGGQGVAAAIYEGAAAIIPQKSDSASYVPTEGQYVGFQDAVDILKPIISSVEENAKFKKMCVDRIKQHSIVNVSSHWQKRLKLL